jgi:hypothetical protein
LDIDELLFEVFQKHSILLYADKKLGGLYHSEKKQSKANRKGQTEKGKQSKKAVLTGSAQSVNLKHAADVHYLLRDLQLPAYRCQPCQGD